jgi:DHA1 family multidrug resistance protein-like MFS transporter
MAGAALLSAFTYVPILAREGLGISEILVTIIVGGYAATSFISSYIFGRAGDIYGRRLVIKIGLLLSTLTFGLLQISSSFETLLIIRVLNGFCIGMYPGALAAYAYESKMKMGRFATWGALGWGVGTICAGYAAGFNIYYAFLMATIFLSIAFVSALTLPMVPREIVKVPWFPIETLKRNASIYLAVFLRHSSAFAIWTLWPLFLFDIGGDALSIAVVQATNSIAQVLFMVVLTDRLESKRLISLGLITSAITFAWFPFANNIIEILPSQILLGFAWGTLYVGALKYVTENNKERSTASGLLTSILSLSGVAGPIIAAVIYTIWPGYTPIMIYAGLMSLVAYGLFWLNNRNDKPQVLAENIDVEMEEIQLHS